MTAAERQAKRRAKLKAEAAARANGNVGSERAAVPPPEPKPPPPLPDLGTEDGRQELLRQVLDGERDLTGAQATSMRVLLEKGGAVQTDEAADAALDFLRKQMARRQRRVCPNCGYPI